MDDALASLRVLGHEAGAFQHGDVLLDRGEGHVVPRGERRDRHLLSRENARDDVPARRVGEGAKELVQLRIAQIVTYNHMVVR